MTDAPRLPGNHPYVLRDGSGPAHLVAGQVICTLAGVEETAGGFGAVVCDAPLDRGPIPMHWHEREHDTWYCTRGRLQVWCGDESRVLTPGDFAYVRPGDTHSYRSVAPRTRFFGIVAPGGWEEFFVDAGEVWAMTGLPEEGRPFDFSRMGPAMGKHRIMRVDAPVYSDATPLSDADRQLPDGHASYFLDAGYGTRHAWRGHLSTQLLSAEQSNELLDMRVIEGGRGATLPVVRHRSTHMFLYLLEGSVEVTIDGEPHVVVGGDAVNIPAGTGYATRIVSGSARWLVATSGGNGAALWSTAGTPTRGFNFPIMAESDVVEPDSLDGIDATIG